MLFGDFLQLGPVLDGLEKDSRPLLERWVRATCFSHVGIESPSQVASNDGCVALTYQFLFGPQLRGIENEVIYEVLRDAADLSMIDVRPQTEIVLVDVSTIPELARIRSGSKSGRWWTAGVVLSRALAELHVPDGAVGVATPFRAQAEATLAALRDRGGVAGAAVGTVHSFQGREYPVVVFDLVDEGQGWVAKGRRNAGSWEDTGLMAFGVGITPARDQLYLIVDGVALRGVVVGPFRELRRDIDRKEIRLVTSSTDDGPDVGSHNQRQRRQRAPAHVRCRPAQRVGQRESRHCEPHESRRQHHTTRTPSLPR